MLTEKDLQWIIKEAGDTMVQDGNLDINLATSGLRQAAEKLLVLQQVPGMRPIQEIYDLFLASVNQV